MICNPAGELRRRRQPGAPRSEQEPADGAEEERAAPIAKTKDGRPQPQPDQVLPQRLLQGHATGMLQGGPTGFHTGNHAILT